MVNKERQEKIIDIAWGHLYNRLEQDNLLPSQTLPLRTIFQANGFRWAVASIVIVCICTLSVWLFKQNTNQLQNEWIVLHNEQNAPTLATTLEDGSIVFLSAQATIRYPEHFREDKRMITLQGDAFFEVNSQHEQPFVIDTELAEIEVLGTIFHVKSSAQSAFLLAVRTGEVKVTLKKNNQTMYVKAGEAACLESDNLHITEADMHLFSSYFEKIHFKDERVADIVRIINLHSISTQIKILPELDNRKLTITFSGETPELMAQLICMALNLTYSQEQNTIYITK